MTFEELSTRLANDTGLSKTDAKHVIRLLAAEIRTVAAQGGEVAIPGFGRFRLQKTKAYTAGGRIKGRQIPAHAKLGFRAFGWIDDGCHGETCEVPAARPA